ncbi:hypothetical protein ACWCPQ_08415 [Nocardia sp. NPDC001965]
MPEPFLRTQTFARLSFVAAAGTGPQVSFRSFRFEQFITAHRELLVNRRPRRVLGCAPTGRIADRQAMLALPPLAPETGWISRLRRLAGARGSRRSAGKPAAAVRALMEMTYTAPELSL